MKRQEDLVVFDGECVLCSGFFQFLLRNDRKKRFAFATAQSPLGQKMYRDLGLPTDEFETNLVVVDGVTHQRLDAFAAAMSALGWPWRGLSVCHFLPVLIKDPLYHLVARNRYRLFGRYNSCIVPDQKVRDRFAEGGL